MKTYSTWMRGLRIITGTVPDLIYRAVFSRDIILFFYHVISDDLLPHIQYLYAYKSLGMFEHDLIYVLKN